MLNDFIKRLSPQNQGNLLIGIGLILLLSVLNLLQGLNFLIIIASICLIWYGFVQADYDKKIKALIFKK